jgi:hypothetical protein
MARTNGMTRKGRRPLLLTTGAVALLIVVASVGARAQTRQEHVHEMAHGVMPFDLAKTVHVFSMTESGGVERVIVRDPADVDQLPLIRQHLQKEAQRFQLGDYSDPALLHGARMAGIDELARGARRIRVSYGELPDGARIVFKASDAHLVTAIHRWFGAQLSEHGADARAE